jgi:hypothetical protein
MSNNSADNLREAMVNWENVYKFKRAFIEKNTDPEGGEPLCGYDDWDEYLMDINYDLADAGEFLADAVTKFLEAR